MLINNLLALKTAIFTVHLAVFVVKNHKHSKNITKKTSPKARLK
jgi:hypothetical protein